jgi:hypothetical protein
VAEDGVRTGSRARRPVLRMTRVVRPCRRLIPLAKAGGDEEEPSGTAGGVTTVLEAAYGQVTTSRSVFSWTSAP